MKPPNGHWFISEKGKRSARSTAIFAVIVTLSGILFNAYVLNFEIMMPGIPAVISNGIIPLLILCFSWQVITGLSEDVQAFKSRTGAGRFCVYHRCFYCSDDYRDIFQGKRYGTYCPGMFKPTLPLPDHR